MEELNGQTQTLSNIPYNLYCSFFMAMNTLQIGQFISLDICSFI